jgi:hypothetical protein
MQSALTARQAREVMSKQSKRIEKKLDEFNILDYDPEFDGDEDWTEMSNEELEMDLLGIDVEKLKEIGKKYVDKARGQQAKK